MLTLTLQVYGNLTVMYRGVPLGYIAALEQRLLVTEIALIEALSSFHDKPPKFLSTSEKRTLRKFDEARSKDARMEEWKKFPLEHVDDKQAWSNAKRQKLRERVVEEDIEVVTSTVGDRQQDSTWLESSPIIDSQNESIGNSFAQFDDTGVAENMSVFEGGHGSGNVLDMDEEIAGTSLSHQHISLQGREGSMVGCSSHTQQSGTFEQVSDIVIPSSGWRNGEEEPRGVLRQTRRSNRSLNNIEWQNYF